MKQLPLFERPPYVAGSETSKAAAIDIEPKIGRLQAKVLAHLRLHPEGYTDEQMQICIPMAASTQRPRRVELVGKGLVRHSGREGKTSSGKRAAIWIAVANS